MRNKILLYVLCSLIGLFGLMVLSSCGSQNATEDHGHEHPEGNAEVVTLRSGGIEIFMEYEYSVIGAGVQFITHVSSIESGEPRREGPITFVLRHSSSPAIEREIPQPARDGIYLPEIEFPASGEWEHTILVPGEGGLTEIVMPPVIVYATQHDADHAEAPEEIAGISFLKEQQWKLLTKMQPVTTRTMVKRISVPAKVVAKPGNRAAVLPPVAGTLVRAEGRSFPSIGQNVRAGELLAAVKAPLAGADLFSAETARTQLIADIARADARLIEERAAYEREKQNYERVRSLFERNAKSKREMEQAEYAYTSAGSGLEAAERVKVTYEQAKKRLDAALGETGEQNSPLVPISSPIDGVIVDVNAAMGDSVLSDEPLFTILNAETVRLDAHIRSEHLQSINGAFPAAYTLGDGTNHRIADRGRLAFRGIELDPETKTLPVIYELDNADGRLIIGSVFTLHIESENTVESLAVPASAIVEEDGQPVAYVQISGETFERRILQTGITDDGYVQVLDGLREGEWVVVDGAYAVRLAAVSTGEVGHGHTH